MNGVRGHLGVCLAVLMWGWSFQAGGLLAEHHSPWWLTLWRYTFAAAAINLLAWTFHNKGMGIPAGQLPRVIMMGLFGHTLFSLCFFAGLRTTAPPVAAVISGLEPALALGMGSMLLRRPAGIHTWLGTAAALLGVILVVTDGGSIGLAAADWSGPLLVLASAASFAAYSLMGEGMARHMPPLPLAAATMRWSLPVLWVAAPLGGEAPRFPTESEGVGLAFFALGVTVAAFLGWNTALKHLGLQRTVVWANLVPVVGVLTAACLGRAVAPGQWGGLVLTVLGVIIAQKGEMDPGRSPAPKGQTPR